MVWTPWVWPPPQLVNVYGFVDFTPPNSTVIFPKLLPLPGSPGNTYAWGRAAGGLVRSTAWHVVFGVLPPVLTPQVEVSWDAAKDGGAIDGYSGEGLGVFGNLGYYSSALEVGPGVPTHTRYETEMSQIWGWQDFTEIVAYRPSRPDEFTELSSLIEGVDFHRAPDGSYIRNNYTVAPKIVGYKLRTHPRPTQSLLQQTTQVNVVRDGGLAPYSVTPGWVVPGALGSAVYSYDALSQGLLDAPGMLGLFDEGGTRMSARFFAASTEGEWPGFNASTSPSTISAGDQEYTSLGISAGWAVVQYPPFSVWGGSELLLRWLNHLSPLVWSWLLQDAWLSIRISVTQSYY